MNNSGIVEADDLVIKAAYKFKEERQTKIGVDISLLKNIPIAGAFVQKFGGGLEGHYIADLAKFVTLCVPANRKVEASKLDAFNTLKLEATEMCP